MRMLFGCTEEGVNLSFFLGSEPGMTQSVSARQRLACHPTALQVSIRQCYETLVLIRNPPAHR
jgi:hypothetical protein